MSAQQAEALFGSSATPELVEEQDGCIVRRVKEFFERERWVRAAGRTGLAVCVSLGASGCGLLAVDVQQVGAAAGGLPGEAAGGFSNQEALSEGGSGEGSPEGGASAQAHPAACELPLKVETYSLKPGTDHELAGTTTEACYELDPAAAVKSSTDHGDFYSLDVPEGKSVEVSVPFALPHDALAGVVDFAAGNGGDVDVVQFEHSAGVLDCPMSSFRSMIFLAEGFLLCRVEYEPGRWAHERCACTGEPPGSLASIRRMRFRVTGDTVPAYLGKEVRFCAGDCNQLF